MRASLKSNLHWKVQFELWREFLFRVEAVREVNPSQATVCMYLNLQCLHIISTICSLGEISQVKLWIWFHPSSILSGIVHMEGFTRVTAYYDMKIREHEIICNPYLTVFQKEMGSMYFRKHIKIVLAKMFVIIFLIFLFL